jgi:hypothetical protein
MARATPMPEYDDVLGARSEAHSGTRVGTSPAECLRWEKLSRSVEFEGWGLTNR